MLDYGILNREISLPDLRFTKIQFIFNDFLQQKIFCLRSFATSRLERTMWTDRMNVPKEMFRLFDTRSFFELRNERVENLKTTVNLISYPWSCTSMLGIATAYKLLISGELFLCNFSRILSNYHYSL